MKFVLLAFLASFALMLPVHHVQAVDVAVSFTTPSDGSSMVRGSSVPVVLHAEAVNGIQSTFLGVPGPGGSSLSNCTTTGTFDGNGNWLTQDESCDWLVPSQGPSHFDLYGTVTDLNGAQATTEITLRAVH